MQKRSSVEHSTYLSPETDKVSPTAPIYNNASATNIIKAFRELQAKQKDVEQERLFAIKERDELRHKLSDLRRGQALWRSKAEIEATENFLTLRTANDRLKYEYGDVEAKLAAQESKYNAIERHRIALRSMQGTLQDDVSQNDARIGAMEHQNAVLRAELHMIESRITNLNRAAIRSPEAHRKHSHNILRTVESLEHEIDKVKLAKARTLAKTTALQSYMDLIIKINGDLSDTLINREQIKAEIMRLSSKTHPPRYAWPKEVRSPSIERRKRSHSEAAAAVVKAAIDSAAVLNSQLLHHSNYLPSSRASTPGSRRASSANRSRSTAASSKSIARQGAVNYATRFAAAATAAATAARVHNTPSPVKSARNSPSATYRFSAEGLNTTTGGASRLDTTGTHADRQEPRACFIPAGNQSNEFNVVASVSKAARAAKELSATIASK